ncbi:MAG: hypothetical protein QXP61_07755 [Nitrososphaerales archaeon]
MSNLAKNARSRVKKQSPHVVKEKGVFGCCDCGHEIFYYSDRGIRCSACNKLYGTWKEKVSKQR